MKNLQDAIIELNELNKKFKEIQSKYNSKKEDLTDYIFEKAKQDKFEFSNESLISNAFYSVSLVSPKQVEFDIEKLEGKLDKELVNEFVDKTYTINDMQGLVLYLKSCGVNPKKFKTFVNVQKKVNNKKLEQLSALGDITEKDIKGCYSVRLSSRYVKIQEKVVGKDS